MSTLRLLIILQLLAFEVRRGNQGRVGNTRTPEHAKAQFPKTSIIVNNRVVFDIAGNRYRLIVSMNYKFQAADIKFFGTHAEYGRIDAASVYHTGVSHGKKDS